VTLKYLGSVNITATLSEDSDESSDDSLISDDIVLDFDAVIEENTVEDDSLSGDNADQIDIDLSQVMDMSGGEEMLDVFTSSEEPEALDANIDTQTDDSCSNDFGGNIITTTDGLDGLEEIQIILDSQIQVDQS